MPANLVYTNCLKLKETFCKTTNLQDNDHHEQYVCYILGITSAWVLLPAWLGLQLGDVRDGLGYTVCLGHVFVYLCSNWHWIEHNKNSTRAWFDTIFSLITILLLICRMLLFNYSKTIYGASTCLVFISGMFYWMSSKIRYDGSNDLGMWCHVLFRVFIFWFSLIVLVPSAISASNALFVVPFLNSCYFTHIVITRFLTKDDNDFYIKQHIIRGNVHICVFIALCGTTIILQNHYMPLR